MVKLLETLEENADKETMSLPSWNEKSDPASEKNPTVSHKWTGWARDNDLERHPEIKH